MSETVIETHRLTRWFGRKQALSELSLRVPRGGIHALVGSNGAGKSTLFRILLGMVAPSTGTCRMLGVDSQHLTPEVRGRVGLVNEEHTLPSWMSVAGVTAMHRALYPRWHEETFREVAEHFRVLPEQKVGQLSRGERAGINLALALAQRPELLILDEPTLGLDVVAKQAFLESVLFAGAQDDRTIVYCSHQMDEVERVADNLILLESGRLAGMSAPDAFCARVSAWMARFASPLPVFDALPGLLQTRVIDGRQQIVVLDQDDSFATVLARLGGDEIQRVPLGLDRAVNAFLTRGHAAPNA